MSYDIEEFANDSKEFLDGATLLVSKLDSKLGNFGSAHFATTSLFHISNISLVSKQGKSKERETLGCGVE